MLLFAILSLLVGTLLGQRFPVLILAPAVFLALVFTICAGVARAESLWIIGLSAATAITCLQVGYLLGLAIHHLAVTAQSNSFTTTFPPRRAAH